MSFGIFEAAVNSEQEVSLAKQASADKFNAAVYDVREKLGPFLFAANSLEEFRDRVAICKNDQSVFKLINAHLHPGASVLRRVVGRNGELEREFKDRLAHRRQAVPTQPSPGIDTPPAPGLGPTDNNAAPSLGLGTPAPAPIPGTPSPLTARRHQGELDGTVDVKNTFKPSDDTLEPEGNFDGYLNKVDQGAEGKIDKLFASREAMAFYSNWCQSNGLSPIRMSSLDTYAQNLNDEQYLRLANTILAWENEHHPKVPKTKLKKKDKVAFQGPVHDDFFPYGEDPEEAEGHAHHLPPVQLHEPEHHREMAAKVPPWESEHHPKTHKTKLPKKDKVAATDAMGHYLTWCDRNNLKRLSANNLWYYTQHDPKLAVHLATRMKAIIHTARLGRRRTAAPDYLQKADDALTQLLNQKAEEFQETIQPLQQALITVQQATQLQQQQNPLNVLPPPGTVNVMPGQPDSPAGQLGMPDPNAPDLSSAINALANPIGGAPGGAAPPGGPPGGAPDGGTGGPPPAAAAQGAAPPGVIPQPQDPSQPKAASRGGQGKGRGAARPRSGGIPIKDIPPHRGDGSDEDRRNWDAEMDDTPSRHHRYVPTEDMLDDPAIWRGGSRRQGCWPGCHENEEHARKYHQDKKEGQRKQAWSGWGPAQFPKTREVTGWKWDSHLEGYKANAPQRFACECGSDFPTPTGFRVCGGCGRQWNSYVIGGYGNNKEASADTYLVREIPVRHDVIVGSKKQGEFGPKDHNDPFYTGDDIPPDQQAKPIHESDGHHMGIYSMIDPRTGAIHELIDPGEITGEGEDPGHPTFKEPPSDWAQRSPAQGNPGQWTKKELPV